MGPQNCLDEIFVVEPVPQIMTKYVANIKLTRNVFCWNVSLQNLVPDVVVA